LKCFEYMKVLVPPLGDEFKTSTRNPESQPRPSKPPVPEALTYSCIHWATHLVRSQALSALNNGQHPITIALRLFVDEHCQYWIEWMNHVDHRTDLRTVLKELLNQYDNSSPDCQQNVDRLIWQIFSNTGFYPTLDITKEVRSDRKVLGGGRYGMVYETSWHGRSVAVKILNRDWSRDSILEIIARPRLHTAFFREIREIQAITVHENVLPLIGYYFHKDKTELGFVSPRAEGNLRLWAEEYRGDHSGDLQRYHYLSQMAKGLQHLHKCGVVHGNLHATNVLVGPNNIAMVTDFGLSKLSKLLCSNSYGDCHIPPLPLPWLAPELIKNHRGLCTKFSDLFALGRTVIEIFTGQDPFHNENIEDLQVHILTSHYPSHPNSLGNVIWSILLGYWSDNPSMRGSMDKIISFAEGMIYGT